MLESFDVITTVTESAHQFDVEFVLKLLDEIDIGRDQAAIFFLGQLIEDDVEGRLRSYHLMSLSKCVIMKRYPARAGLMSPALYTILAR